MGKAPPEAAEEDCRPTFDEGERVTPEAEGETKPEVGGEGRIRRLPRQVRRDVRDPDADRIQPLVEPRRLVVDPSKQGLRVGDRGRSREDSKR